MVSPQEMTCLCITHVAVKLPGSLGIRKAGTPNPMTAAGKQEHAIVAQTIEEIIGPRLTGEVQYPFVA